MACKVNVSKYATGYKHVKIQNGHEFEDVIEYTNVDIAYIKFYAVICTFTYSFMQFNKSCSNLTKFNFTIKLSGYEHN